MPRGVPIDIRDVHQHLWDVRTRRGVVRIDHAQLAGRFGCTLETVSRLVRRLVEGGRVRQVSRGRKRTGLFAVRDPEDLA